MALAARPTPETGCNCSASTSWRWCSAEMPSLLSLIPGCFAIRVHGRRWLKVTKAHIGPDPAIGWRAITWTTEVADAEKWMTRAGAERFIEMLRCPCEIVDLERRSGTSPVIA